MMLIVCIVVLGILIFIRSIFTEQKNKREKELYFRDRFGSYSKKDYSFQGKGHRKFLLDNRTDPQVGDSAYVDDITWKDLHLEDVYEQMDVTLSAVGEEVLYEWLHRPDKSPEEEALFDSLLTCFEEDVELRVKVQMALDRLGFIGKHSPFSYIREMEAVSFGNSILDIGLDLLFVPGILLLYFYPLWGGAFILCLLLVCIYRYFQAVHKMDGYMGCISYVLRMLQVFEQVYSPLRTCVKKALPEHSGEDILSLKKQIGHCHFLLAFGNRTKSATGSGPITMLLEYINMVFHFDQMEFRRVFRLFSRYREELFNALYFLGLLDASISVLHYRKSLAYFCIPEEGKEQKGIELEEGFHPLLSKPVPASIQAQKCILLTGSNASGKSTFLRMVALNVILAQTIHTVCAKRYNTPKYCVVSAMSVSDDLLAGDSYYIAELKATARIFSLTEKQKLPILCFVDEVLKGTNTVERISAGGVILQQFVKCGIHCFAATHDRELTVYLQENYDNYHFAEHLQEGEISFDYILQKGPAKTRNAIALLGTYGFPDEVIQRAEEFAHQLDGRFGKKV